MRRISGNSSTEASDKSTDSAFSTQLRQMNMMNIQRSVSLKTQPYLQIIEQPTDIFRFRYLSERPNIQGLLTGISKNKRYLSYPTAHLFNFSGDAVIRCTLYNESTTTGKKSIHSHSLVVHRENGDGRDPHYIMVSPKSGYTAIYKGMDIIHTAKKFIAEKLLEKMLDHQQLLLGRETTDSEKASLRCQAEQEAKDINPNQVCLCFEAFEKVGRRRYVQICKPILSKPINNLKRIIISQLNITRLSATFSDAAGNTELFLFVDKLGKQPIRVRFFQNDKEDELIWEDYGKEVYVHHEYAIALRTPAYMKKEIEDRVKVNLQLVRISDNCVSSPVPFFYKPSSHIITRKRARMSSTYKSAKNQSDCTVLDVAHSAANPEPGIVNMGNSAAVEAVSSCPTPNTTANDDPPLFDHTCLTELSAVFNEGNRWKQLARAIRCEGMVATWEGETNPSLEVLAYMGLNGYALHHVVNVFLGLDIYEALVCLDNMIPRREDLQ